MTGGVDSILSEYHAEIERKSEKIFQMLDALKESLGERPLVLYGRTTIIDLSILEILIEWNVPVKCFCDIAGLGGELGDIPIIDAQTLINDYADAIVVICPDINVNNSQNELIISGFSPQQIIPVEWSEFVIILQIILRKFQSLGRHIDRYYWAHDFFEDKISKQTVLDRLRMYVHDIPMEINSSCSQYFEDGYINLGEREIFADCGAHIGDSAIEFIKMLDKAKGGYAHIYSFEPDSRNYALAVKNTSKYPNVTVIPKGLWSTETELEFFEKNDTFGSSFAFKPGSTVIGNVIQHVPVTSLDIFFAGKPDSELPTFIKMDIEGSEKEALIGARDIIRRVKPKLAICAYHKLEDIYALPQTIMRIRDDYKFALRQYQNGPYETVLYAV